ncbi:MAG: ATP-binding protein [Candidatus Azobacteroides sp.]|nr:ATP-binding protein [Candidatus Azobacteroides sp.]
MAVFTAGIIVVEHNRERLYKTEGLESTLNGYAELIHKFILKNRLTGNNIDSLQQIMPLLPHNIRVTIINEDGSVLFDNDFADVKNLENHKNRPEILKAMIKPYGTNVRNSVTTHTEYLYYAIHCENCFIRVALPYDIRVKAFLKSDNVFLYIIIFLFVIVNLALNYILNRFGKSISRLRDFVVSVQNGNPVPDNISFPNDELGQIADSVVEVYRTADKNKKKIAVEREKFLQHFHYSGEGLCFFTKDRKNVYANTHFLQLLNFMIDKPTLNPECIFEEKVFKEVQEYLKNPEQTSLFTTKINLNGKFFSIRVFVFEDNSFEITISDISQSEKTRLLKQEMTNNIAHELRTPVASIRGFLETLMEQKNIDEEKRNFFLERAHSQVIRLSELIRDINLITKTEEAPDRFEVEKIPLLPLLNELKDDLEMELSKHNIRMKINVSDEVILNGNRTLLYSIFRNLVDNSIRYGGGGINIFIDNYAENPDYYYFSYYDTGKGVEEVHLSRLFERFYRVNEGRTRNTGGSGLGLSIVKNAVLFHKGEIVAKNRAEGGLEFLFTLKK